MNQINKESYNNSASDNNAGFDYNAKILELEAKKKIVEKEILEAKARAEKIIKNAENESEKIFEKARNQGYKKGFEEGYNKGYEEGHEKGIEKSYEDKNSILDEAIGLRNKAQDDYEDILKSSEENIVNMIIKLSQKIIYKNLEEDRENIIKIVEEAIKKCSYRKKVTLKVSYDDFAVVSNNRDRILSKIENLEVLDIIYDDNITIGSCKVETEYGNLYSTLEEKIRIIEDSFREILELNMKTEV
jgi:flagellar assembly protein FliH